MKILVITPFFPAYPEDKHGKFIYDSVCALHDLGMEIKVLVTTPWKPKWLFPKSTTQKIQTHTFPSWLTIQQGYFLSLPRYLLFLLSIWSYAVFITPLIQRIISSWKCDVIHIHSEVNTLTAVKIGKKLGIPVVTTIHGAETNQRYWRASKKIIAHGLAQVNRVILVGEAIKPFFTNLVKHAIHFQVVHNGFSAPSAMQKKSAMAWETQLQLVSVSTLADEGKGIDVNLHALAKLRQLGISQWQYKIVGDGCFRKELALLTKKLQLEDHVQFVGACDHHQVYHYLSQANIFCLPSYREAFGIAHLEAMACGLLVVGVQEQGPKAFITHQTTGILVKPNNVDDLTQWLQYIFTHREEMQKIAIDGKDNAWKNFTWQHHAQQLLLVYRDFIQR